MKLNWKLSTKRNSAVIAVITLLLAVAVYLNWSYGQDLEPEAAPIAGMEDVQYTDSGETLAAAESDAQRFAENEWQISSALQNVTTDGSTQSTGDVPTAQPEYFDNARLSRQQSKDEALTLLQTTLADENVSADARNDAQAAIAAMASNAICESRIESLVMAKGFADCVAIVDNGTVSVVVQPPEDGLIASDVARIKDIILSETSVTADKIRVIEAD